ncbi:MAG: hypothetical protein LBQ83_03060 [Candidatus Margulisbacteria bacterium]|jgi:uncharacterized phage protein gp47/JayE|nr:hypothetical protein [Candidatus Margulisiibacteriota bacterium]
MPDIFNADGLTVETLPEIRQEIIDGFKATYGSNIVLDQDTPDGQMINIFAQSAADIREMLLDIVASLDPDQAEGRVLDQRVALNGLVRKAGTYTMVSVDITVDRALNLQGLDTGLYDINGSGYTVKDGIGNLFILAESQNFSAAGTYHCLFRAKEIGQVLVAPNTITLPETVVLGVTALNNPSAAVSQGQNEETDAELRIRRARSFGINSVGQLDALEAALWSIANVTACHVRENYTDIIDVYNVPPHSIWCIVEGGTDEDIGAAIYAKRSDGCGTFGAQSVTVNRSNGRTAIFYFDRPVYVPLYIKFRLGYIGGGELNQNELKEYIVNNLKYNLDQIATADEVTNTVKKFNSQYFVEDTEISTDNTTWAQIIDQDSPQKKFTISTSNIDIEDV